MKSPLSRTETRSRKRRRKAHHTATVGRASVSVYRRKTPHGRFAYMVANYATGKRRFDSYSQEVDAIEAAGKLAKQLSERQVVAAAMTNEQATEYAAAVEKLKPFNVGLLEGATGLASVLKIVGDLGTLLTAAKYHVTRNKPVERKRVADVVAELLKVKQARGSSQRYLSDLRSRLNRFAADCRKDACNVTTSDVQAWLDSQKLAPQSYVNFRRVLSLLFGFAKSRGYAAENPVDGCERVKVGNGSEITIYTPSELTRLLAAAKDDFLPALAIGAFCGLRSAELARLQWSDVDLNGGHVTVTAKAAKTASRRLVPIPANLKQWLAPHAKSKGHVWPLTERRLYKRMQETAAATELNADPKQGIKTQPAIEWKHNALRHSFISYRLAETQDAGKVALEAGNSPTMIFRHYRELVKPADAAKWFAVAPEQPANVVRIAAEG